MFFHINLEKIKIIILIEIIFNRLKSIKIICSIFSKLEVITAYCDSNPKAQVSKTDQPASFLMTLNSAVTLTCILGYRPNSILITTCKALSSTAGYWEKPSQRCFCMSNLSRWKDIILLIFTLQASIKKFT